MHINRLSLLIKICLLTGLSVLASPLLAADKTISELVDAVNGTPDTASREAGKKIKLRNHAKGFCTSGTFIPNPKLLQTLAIPFFEQPEIAVTARFSLGGTSLLASDKGAGRFMSLKIDGDKESLNFVTTNSPVFFASDLEEFFNFQTKVKQGAEGKQWLMDHQPNAKAFFDYSKTLPSSVSFANSRYFGVNSFLFTANNDEIMPGRWIFEPVDGVSNFSPTEREKLPDDFLQTELLTRIKQQPAAWDLYIKLALPSDEVNDPTVLWPDTRQRLLVGQVLIDGSRDNETATMECDKGIFNPVLLPKGITPSADPILNARTPAYIESFIRRL
ncbi:catalase family peroxidase [Shewanella sp. D64]|uniref:catalase family peroxidase n=1 Tax=unclassified Shewanella TaxID=196818 RepID=UPI0022BA2629|nr:MULTISPECIES: catalase family peroxidase [unclassified Shewanella]MEC4727174.1 catalase family peroxidase [Shewanella sp. D64]MEC4739209.1 catalase family peroxidase [Shewanella sp. E94]WBJ95550.1 catalase family peroxidase [Shewanella sp. MTB7]